MENLNMESFKEKVFDFENKEEWEFAGDKPAIIDFYADWCGPCRAVKPVLEELAKEYDGKLDVYKINTEKESDLAGIFGISNIPSILFIPKSGTPKMSNGAMTAPQFREIIKSVLNVD